MPRAVKMPLTVNVRGGLDLTDDGLEELLAASYMPSASANPYMAVLGVYSPDYTFGLNDLQARSAIRRQSEELFRELEREGRARLLSVSISESDGSGKLQPVIRYERIGRPSGAETFQPEVG
jgi:hypothetical protein